MRPEELPACPPAHPPTKQAWQCPSSASEGNGPGAAFCGLVTVTGRPFVVHDVARFCFAARHARTHARTHTHSSSHSLVTHSLTHSLTHSHTHSHSLTH
jgi:hypothetical protein